MLLHATQDKAPQGAETLKFFDWAFKNGDQAADDLDYISLPVGRRGNPHAMEGEGQGRVGQGDRASRRNKAAVTYVRNCPKLVRPGSQRQASPRGRCRAA